MQRRTVPNCRTWWPTGPAAGCSCHTPPACSWVPGPCGRNCGPGGANGRHRDGRAEAGGQGGSSSGAARPAGRLGLPTLAGLLVFAVLVLTAMCWILGSDARSDRVARVLRACRSGTASTPDSVSSPAMTGSGPRRTPVPVAWASDRPAAPGAPAAPSSRPGSPGRAMQGRARGPAPRYPGAVRDRDRWRS